MKFKKKLSAFTLAEVLIVIGIIGIVAKMTISGLIIDIQEKEMVSRLKKAYSMLSQATAQINSDCGGDIKNCVTLPDSGDAAPAIEVSQLYRNKIKTLNNCDTAPGCFSSDTYKDTMYTGNMHNTHLFAKFITIDGYSMGIDYNGNGYPDWGLFHFVVDVNGDKRPNQAGRDVFYFGYNPVKKALEPFGSAYFDQACTPWIDSWDDQGCAAKVLTENAINYFE